jgi:hypothetical protein
MLSELYELSELLELLLYAIFFLLLLSLESEDFDLLLEENPSLLQLPPKKEHKTSPNSKIKKRNNASVFIV